VDEIRDGILADGIHKPLTRYFVIAHKGIKKVFAHLLPVIIINSLLSIWLMGTNDPCFSELAKENVIAMALSDSNMRSLRCFWRFSLK